MRDLDFDAMHLFARVAELGTLSAVARERDVPVSQVSRTLARIEKACGVRLIHRSTHGLSLSAEGDTFLDYCRRLTGTLDELEGEFASRAGQAGGRVRVAVSSVIAQFQLLPSLPGLAARHPGIKVELEVSDRLADMARDGIDISIRTGINLPDTVVARRIGTLGRALYASPSYAKAHGLPAHPDDLRHHRLVCNSAVPSLKQWAFLAKGKPLVFTAQAHWQANDTNVMAGMVLQGLGIGRMATLAGEPLVREQRLLRVLEEFVDPQAVPVYAVTLASRHRLPKIGACLEWWSEWFARADSAAAARTGTK
ncbi:LysR family transcriptional regulator [Caenimonas terrae]|uniref:LysR family transcriptional regulator n=1 Tax=Caenimonas terrae TaxID=696074 RepID=A0ABW0N791_9BURK